MCDTISRSLASRSESLGLGKVDPFKAEKLGLDSGDFSSLKECKHCLKHPCRIPSSNVFNKSIITRIEPSMEFMVKIDLWGSHK